jgi:sulfocyanin
MTRIYVFQHAAFIVAVLGVLGLSGADGAATRAAFSIIAAQTSANNEYNFNGADRGHLVVTVPVGAAVQLTLTNKGGLPHSLEVIPYTAKLPATALPTPAFPGAVSKNPQMGIAKGQTAVVEFTAGTPGKYLLICGFPGHALLGMYGIFEVSPSATATPSLIIKK